MIFCFSLYVLWYYFRWLFENNSRDGLSLMTHFQDLGLGTLDANSCMNLTTQTWTDRSKEIMKYDTIFRENKKFQLPKCYGRLLICTLKKNLIISYASLINQPKFHLLEWSFAHRTIPQKYQRQIVCWLFLILKRSSPVGMCIE